MVSVESAENQHRCELEMERGAGAEEEALPCFSNQDQLVGNQGTKRKRDNRWPPVPPGQRFRYTFTDASKWSVAILIQVTTSVFCADATYALAVRALLIGLLR